MPIGFHPTGNTSLKDDSGRRFVGHANFHPIAHAIRNPVELMVGRKMVPGAAMEDAAVGFQILLADHGLRNRATKAFASLPSGAGYA